MTDPAEASLSGVKAVWLAYPYIGPFAFNRLKPWRHCPRVLAVTCKRDHLTTVRNAEQVNAMIRNCGSQVESWIAGAPMPSTNPPTTVRCVTIRN